MLDTFRLPKDFLSLVYLSMALQAEGIRYGVEHWRRHIDRVAGTLYWQLNDCWPVASWSSLDYYGRWKALHYAARRFYAPLLLSIEDMPPTQGIYITNDFRDCWEGDVRWSLETLSGDVVTSGEEHVQVAPQAVVHVCTLNFADRLTDDDRHNLIFVAELWQNDRRVTLQVAAFVPTKYLALIDPGVAANLRVEDGQLIVQLTAHSLARLIEVALDNADVIFSDNYFDLPANRVVTISCPLPAGWTLEQARAAFRIRSVYDSFAGC
jgi:beta-mannosidase